MIEGDAQTLIQAALDYGTSDIHIMPTRTEYRIYFRSNGQLFFHKGIEVAKGTKLISYFKFLADMDVGEKRRPQSGSTAFVINDVKIELRLSTITSVIMLESIVIRILKQVHGRNQDVYTYFQQDINHLQRLIRRKNGLILFSGPVGSGKTTTIYQLLRERLQQETLQIITMEDPVEMYEEKFLQVEVNEKADIGYDTIIKSSLRHHPDILMIGEIRDEETARMAIRGALTGHLMIASIHAKNALGVIGRLQELMITPEQLQQTLIGVTSQRLVPRYCPVCQGPCQPQCHQYPSQYKRAAIFEIIDGSLIQAYFSHQVSMIKYETLNHKLRKAWSYGYIDEATFYKFELI